MLRALMDFPYAGRTIQRGEVFTAVSDDDARILVLGERAESCAEAIEKCGTQVPRETLHLKLDAKRYKRRDMRAEG